MKKLIKKALTKKTMILLLLILGLFCWWWKTPAPKRVRPANVGVRSFSVGWYTQGSSKSCVVAAKSWKPKDWLINCEKKKTAWHLVDLIEAEPQTTYHLVLIDGLRVSWKNILSVKTKEMSDQPPGMPVPAYGNVIDNNQKPAVGVLVYIMAEASTFHYPVAAMTNAQGNYGMDVGELKQAADSFLVEAVGNRGYWAELPISHELITPIPTIMVINK